MTIVKLEHCKELGFCAKGMRQFFKRYNLDWELFRREGIEEEKILATNDAMARQAVGLATQKQGVKK